ncbi:MAG: glycoside hydrolase family 97 N-terminal domain-containing protein, partial [Muribaculaceae bacterium]|nr:glycoside hydrolase family 97 N-terminal domain-containing protein [Muribaculaceae bacterium]
MKNFICPLAAAMLLSACAGAPSVSSPDGSIKVDVNRDGSSLSYAVTVGGDTLIAPSMLGFEAEGLTPAADAKMT